MDGVHTHCRSRGADGVAFVVQGEGSTALGKSGLVRQESSHENPVFALSTFPTNRDDFQHFFLSCCSPDRAKRSKAMHPFTTETKHLTEKLMCSQKHGGILREDRNDLRACHFFTVGV